MSCSNGRSFGDLVGFGLAAKGQFIKGQGQNVNAQTIERCSLGTMTDLRREQHLIDAFAKFCAGKRACSLPVDLEKVFLGQCLYDLQDRMKGRPEKLAYGPPRIYAWAQCHEKDIRIIGQKRMTRQEIALLVVYLDIVVLLLFVLAIFRLKFYEPLTIHDLRQGSLRIDDFSVQMIDIPLSKSEYNNNPEYLNAVMVTHFEDIISGELQFYDQLEEVQQFQNQVASIHYGMTSQNIMKHLVAIFSQAKKIHEIKKKMKNDPLNAKDHEKQMWKRYNKVTYHKDAYYKEKASVEPAIMNAYITFRSMEGK